MGCVGDRRKRLSVCMYYIQYISQESGAGGAASSAISSYRTLFPTTSVSPEGLQARLNASPRPLISLMAAFVLTSQNFTTPSLLTLQSSASFTGLKATFSIPAVWPLSSVEYRTLGLSGFHTRRVLSTDPVAIRVPVGFHPIERILMNVS